MSTHGAWGQAKRGAKVRCYFGSADLMPRLGARGGRRELMEQAV
ncbi:hypothetical protein [Hyalangium versicolor]|nr:hypothetical protein [Hyalangium versicolor]